MYNPGAFKYHLISMVWEFPAVSQTRREFWDGPQYNRQAMWLFTLFFGFFGLHHLLLRSPQTAIMVFLANLLTFPIGLKGLLRVL